MHSAYVSLAHTTRKRYPAGTVVEILGSDGQWIIREDDERVVLYSDADEVWTFKPGPGQKPIFACVLKEHKPIEMRGLVWVFA